MKKPKKRGRKKGSTKGEPTNFIFWKGMLKDNNIQDFIDRGSTEQKTTIINVLKYLKNMQPEFFKQVNGRYILKQLKSK